MHWSFQKENYNIPRLHILSPLFVESCNYFPHDVLCASILNRKMYLLPFCRDIDINFSKMRAMKDTLMHCKNERGFFIVTPEHRLSLELKQKEIHLLGNEIQLSQELEDLTTDSWYNIFDEVDEILHHRFQLIYAIGSAEGLPQGKYRWEAAEALLHVIYLMYFDGVVLSPESSIHESFPFTRFIADNSFESLKFRTAA